MSINIWAAKSGGGGGGISLTIKVKGYAGIIIENQIRTSNRSQPSPPAPQLMQRQTCRRLAWYFHVSPPPQIQVMVYLYCPTTNNSVSLS